MIRFSRADRPSPLRHSAGGVKDIYTLAAPRPHAINRDANTISINCRWAFASRRRSGIISSLSWRKVEAMVTLPDSISERARQGAQVRRDVLGAAYVDAGKQKANSFTKHFIEFTQTQCWGNVWLREGLSHKTRSMLNVCMLAALARWHEFDVHVRGALNNGVTPEEIAEILLHTAVYAGIPIASEGFRRADAVIREVAAEKRS
jgi:4-carboxymuconolactone decarboxylase